ncbi:MAG: S41 family peptidase [Acidobacteriota bacterium]
MPYSIPSTRSIASTSETRRRLAFWIVLAGCLFAFAWPPREALATQAPPTGDEARAVVEALRDVLDRDYVDGAKAELLRAALRDRFEAGRYASAGTVAELAARLTTDLVELSGDLHFHVVVDPDWVAASTHAAADQSAHEREQELADQRSRQNNYGLRDVALLEGDIGYLNLTEFADPEAADELVAAAMQLLASRQALILDLRFNNGGYLEMAQLLCSYFLRSVPSQRLFETSDLENGERLERTQWVLPSVPGDRMPEMPLYVLTSNTSFSAAEWFAFVLKNLGRATVVGETTAGGAHPVQRRALNDRFVLQVPTGAVRDGVLGTDFEGTGVEPDVAASSAAALHVAHRLALEWLRDDPAQDSVRRARAEWFLTVVAARLEPPRLDPAVLDGLPGAYGSRHILREGDVLYYSWDGEGRVRLVPLGGALLGFEGLDELRLRVVTEDDVVTGYERLGLDGSHRFVAKTHF